MKKKFELKEWHCALIGALIGAILGLWNPCDINPHEKTNTVITVNK